MRKTILFIIYLLAINVIHAQQELSPHFLQNVELSNLTNPAFVSSQKTTVILPSAYYSTHTPDFTLKGIFGLDENGIRDINKIADTQLGIRNRITTNINATTLGIAYMATPKVRINVSHAFKADFHADIDGVLIKVLTNSYVENIGKTIPFNSKINGSFYHQLALGGSYQYSKNISLGARIKLLKGIAGFFTRSGQSIVTINGLNYATTYDNNIDVLGYSLDNLKELKSVNGLFKQSLNVQNLGVGLDIGATFKKENWQFSASIIDALSIINWRKNGINYTGSGSYSFAGIGTVSIFQGSIASFNVKDTLKSIIGLKTFENAQYVQKLPTKIYLSAFHNFNDKLQLGALLYDERGGEFPSQTNFMLNASYKIMENIQFGGSWGIRSKRFDNIGLHLIGQYKAVQIYGTTDNIFTIFNPYNHKNVSGRVGVNLILQ